MHLSLAFLEIICIRKIFILYIHIYLFLNIWKPKKSCICLYIYCQVICIKNILYFVHLFSNIRKPQKIMHLSLAFPEFLCIIGFARIPLSPRHQKPRASTFSFSMTEGGLWHSACWELIQFLWHLFVCLWWKSHKQLTAVNEGWDQPYGWSFALLGFTRFSHFPAALISHNFTGYKNYLLILGSFQDNIPADFPPRRLRTHISTHMDQNRVSKVTPLRSDEFKVM